MLRIEVKDFGAVAQGKAHPRHDTATVGRGRETIAFRIDLREMGGTIAAAVVSGVSAAKLL